MIKCLVINSEEDIMLKNKQFVLLFVNFLMPFSTNGVDLILLSGPVIQQDPQIQPVNVTCFFQSWAVLNS